MEFNQSMLQLPWKVGRRFLLPSRLRRMRTMSLLTLVTVKLIRSVLPRSGSINLCNQKVLAYPDASGEIAEFSCLRSSLS